MYISTFLSLASAISLATAQSPSTNAGGLLMVLSKPTHPELTDAVFNQWYSGQHLNDMLRSNITDLILRYKNTNPTAKYPYLALYRLPDVTKASELGQVPSTSELLPGKVKGTKGGAYTDVMDMDTRVFARTQTFEGQVEMKGRGKVLVTAAMGVVNGAEGELDDWYRRQHLDMLSYVSLLPLPLYRQFRNLANFTCDRMIKGYHRSTRYARLDGSNPKFLAMHELDSVTMGSEMKLVLGTEWAKKVLSKVTTSQSDVWEYIIELGKEGLSDAQMKF